MGAFFYYTAGIHHQNAVCFQHGGETMGDHERRAPLHDVVERGLNQCFVFGVER